MLCIAGQKSSKAKADVNSRSLAGKFVSRTNLSQKDAYFVTTSTHVALVIFFYLGDVQNP